MHPVLLQWQFSTLTNQAPHCFFELRGSAAAISYLIWLLSPSMSEALSSGIRTLGGKLLSLFIISSSCSTFDPLWRFITGDCWVASMLGVLVCPECD